MAVRDVEITGTRELDAYLKTFGPKAMDLRFRKALAVGARTLRVPVRAAAPSRSGALAKSVRVKSLRLQAGKPVAVVVGPKVFYGGWVQTGHRIVGPKPNQTDTGRRTRPNKFVEQATRQHEAAAVAAFERELFSGKGIR
jgi:hypothetical protein